MCTFHGTTSITSVTTCVDPPARKMELSSLPLPVAPATTATTIATLRQVHAQVTAAATLHLPSTHNLAPKKKKSRSVHFPSSGLIVQEIHSTLSRYDLTEDEVSNYWWSPQHPKNVIQRAKDLSRKESQSIQEVMKLVEESYKGIQHVFHHSKDTEQDRLGMTQSPAPYSARLKIWTRRAHSMRGMEGILSSRKHKHGHGHGHGHVRKEMCDEIRYSVKQMCQTGKDSDEIQRYYRRASSVAAVFARCLGYADAAAAGTSVCTL